MPKFAANLSMLYPELGFLDRFAAASASGFEAVEYLFPYAFAKEELAGRLRDNGLTQVLFNLPPGDWDKGDRGIACHPGRVREFQDGVEKAINYAGALGCRMLHAMAGIAPLGVPQDRLRAVYLDNIRFAAERLKQAGIRLAVEPINTRDMPGYYLNRSDQAVSLIEEAGSDNIWLQYDIYHAQNMEGDLARTIERHIGRIAHVQLADNPGRHEPGTGEINYPYLFGLLDRLGYDGCIGCEYHPLAATDAGLDWAAAYLRTRL